MTKSATQIAHFFGLSPDAGIREMRKQYYFRPSARGLMAWDVDRLVTLTSRFPRIHVPLTAIRDLDEPFLSDDGGPTWRAAVEHVRLIEAADLSYAIILSSDGRVMDGMHRVAKALLLGRATIEAVQFADDPEPDYVGAHPNELPYDETPIKPANSA
jgi:hypothetical protein